MSKHKALVAILEELVSDSRQIDATKLAETEELICEANRVYVAGAGRSGFAARGFANRLMHLGFNSFFVGETTTPSIQRDDLLIIGSGSGETGSLVVAARCSKKQGAKLATLTMFPNNTIGSLADSIIVIPGITSKVPTAVTKKLTVQPPGSSFEQLSWLTYDAMVVDLKERTGQTNEDMFARHANLE